MGLEPLELAAGGILLRLVVLVLDNLEHGVLEDLALFPTFGEDSSVLRVSLEHRVDPLAVFTGSLVVSLVQSLACSFFGLRLGDLDLYGDLRVEYEAGVGELGPEEGLTDGYQSVW